MEEPTHSTEHELLFYSFPDELLICNRHDHKDTVLIGAIHLSGELRQQ